MPKGSTEVPKLAKKRKVAQIPLFPYFRFP